MELAILIGAALVFAAVVHITRGWALITSALIVAGTAVMIGLTMRAPGSEFDLFGRTLALTPLARLYLGAAILITGAVGLLGALEEKPAWLGFLFWSFPMWIGALLFDNFPFAVFAWVLGLVTTAFGMQPRRASRAGGAAYFLVVTVVAAACLLVANRFFDLYPLTPENTGLVLSGLILLAWGLGLLLAIVPFQVWIGPMADESPLLLTTVIVAWGQPIGVYFLFKLMTRYLWLTQQSDLFAYLAWGGALMALVAGGLLITERRQGRVLAYAGMFSLGVVLMDLSRETLIGLSAGALEILARALGLALLAAGFHLARVGKNVWLARTRVAAILIGGLALAGAPPTLTFAARWSLYLDLAANDRVLLVLLLLGAAGMIFATLRLARGVVVREGKAGEAPARAETKITAAEIFGKARAAVMGNWRTAVAMVVVAGLVVLIVGAGLFSSAGFEAMAAAIGRPEYLR
jgi:formate hydrogenlyase subunit 3/multisubunit Na+/H+ antiporter MnhD subunit